MPSIDSLPLTNDIAVSPISTPWVFDEEEEEENDTETVYNNDQSFPIESQIPAIETSDYSHLQPLRYRYTYYPILTSTEESTAQPLERPLRYIPRFSRLRRQISSSYVSSEVILPTESNQWLSPAHCLNENNMDISYSSSSYPTSSSSHFIKNKPNPSLHSFYPLQFKIVSHDGGCYSSIYDINNILKNDSSVYCSGRNGTVNILLRYCGNRGFMDNNCTLSKIIIRSPGQGFTAPCKEGLIFISHYPIDVENTYHYDHFTKESYQQYSNSTNIVNREDHDPIAWFSINNNQQQEIDIDNRSGKYVLIKLLRSEFDADNIDLQYIGFIGYSGPQSFPSLPKLC